MKNILSIVVVICVVACGDEKDGVEVSPGSDISFGADDDVVVTPDGSYVVSGQTGDECVEVTEVCVEISQAKEDACGSSDAQADVIVGENGEVVEVFCYEPATSENISETEVDADGNVSVTQNENHTVIVFDESTNGVPIEGNLELEAEGLTFFGNGVEETIVDGNFIVASNNAAIRGVSITGNFVLEENSNNTTLSHCRIHGNLEIHSNNVSVLDCAVFGNVEQYGNNASYYYVGVGGNFNTGSTEACLNNYSFEDANSDHLVDDSERGDELSCNL